MALIPYHVLSEIAREFCDEVLQRDMGLYISNNPETGITEFHYHFDGNNTQRFCVLFEHFNAWCESRLTGHDSRKSYVLAFLNDSKDHEEVFHTVKRELEDDNAVLISIEGDEYKDDPRRASLVISKLMILQALGRIKSKYGIARHYVNVDKYLVTDGA